MENEPPTFGLRPEKLAQLWNIGSDTNQLEKAVDKDNRKAELLRDRLAETLTVNPSQAESRQKDRGDMRSVIDSLADEPIDKLINNPNTGVALLRKVKDYGRKLSENAASEAEYQVANIIYYAAIASALVFHGRRITKFSYKNLEKYLRRFNKENWIPKVLLGLFKKASEYCKVRQSGS